MNFPPTNTEQLPTHINESKTVQQILLKLVNSDLRPCDKFVLPATNVFILFKRLELPEDENPLLREIQDFKLPKSCRRFHLHFRDGFDFEIYEDLKNLSVDEKTSTEDPPLENKTWLLSEIFVKGFKDTLVNNKSIWC